MKERKSELTRKTKETNIKLGLNLDIDEKGSIVTGIGFFDHMLDLLAKHGLLGLNLQVEGDLNVDGHHTVEDIGIVMGTALRNALGDKQSIERYSTVFLPMDESMACVSIDISGRPFLKFEAEFPDKSAGDFQTELVEEFFRGLVMNAGITLHIRILYGTNTHHMIEAIFKGFGRALMEAVSINNRVKGVLSTKGVL